MSRHDGYLRPYLRELSSCNMHNCRSPLPGAGGYDMLKSPVLGTYAAPEIEKALRAVTDELRWWKCAMEDLASIFHARFPPVGKRNGWTLHVRRCAKSKECSMCPHSILWVQYCYVKNREETKARLRREGKPAQAYTFIWAKGRRAQSMDGLPAGMRLSPEVRAHFEEFEEVRAVIMDQHRALANYRKRLLAKRRELLKKLENGAVAPTADLESALIHVLSEFILSNRPARASVSKRLTEIRRAYPPSDKAFL